MSNPKSLTLYINGQNTIPWEVTDSSGTPLTNVNANVTMSLVWGRDRIRPDLSPGVTVNNFPVTMSYVGNVFSATVNSLVGVFPGGDYTVIINAAAGLTTLAYWERPAVLILNGS